MAGMSAVSDGDAVGEADVGFNNGVAEGDPDGAVVVATVGELVGEIVTFCV